MRLKRIARLKAKTIDGRLYQWWQSKYKDSAFKPFEKRTHGSILREYFLDLAVELDQLMERRKDVDYWTGLDLEEQSKLEERVNDIERVLSTGEEEPEKLSSDALIDKWEAQIAAGEDPDLDELPD